MMICEQMTISPHEKPRPAVPQPRAKKQCFGRLKFPPRTTDTTILDFLRPAIGDCIALAFPERGSAYGIPLDIMAIDNFKTVGFFLCHCLKRNRE